MTFQVVEYRTQCGVTYVKEGWGYLPDAEPHVCQPPQIITWVSDEEDVTAEDLAICMARRVDKYT